MSASFLTLFIARRLVALVVLLLIISFGVFTLLYLAPGSVEDILRGTRPQTPETAQAIREQYHLNDSFLMQYWIWLKDAIHGDFGSSIRTSEPVSDGIQSRAALSAYLGLYAFAIVMLLGVPLGALAALRKRTVVDRGIVGLGVVGVSAPAFATGIFLLYLFAVRVSWFPAYGQGEGFWDRLWHLTLPAIALALTGMALVIKLTRAAMINALDQDYVVFARARGIPSRRVLVVYAFRNALVPVVTAAGLILGYLLTGAVLVEVTFALPGVGALLVESVTFKDVPMVQGVTLLVAAVIILINLLTDILYLFVDPRVRFGRGGLVSEVMIPAAELPVARTRRRARVSILIVLCFIVVGVVAVFAIFGNLIAPHDPNEQNLLVGLTRPSSEFWLGTDDLGRDVFSRTIVGARTAVVGPILIALGAMLIGNALGLLAGYKGGVVDSTIMRWVDLMWALPGLLVAIVVVGVLGGGYYLSVALLILLTAPYDTRIVRGATLEQRGLPYVEAARTLGLSSKRIMVRHIWPNVLPLVVANTFLNFAFSLVTLSALSFLGLGVGPGTPDWGRMLAESQTLLFDNPAAALAPGGMIVITAASMNLIGDWLYERLSDRGRAR